VGTFAALAFGLLPVGTVDHGNGLRITAALVWYFHGRVVWVAMAFNHRRWAIGWACWIVLGIFPGLADQIVTAHHLMVACLLVFGFAAGVREMIKAVTFNCKNICLLRVYASVARVLTATCSSSPSSRQKISDHSLFGPQTSFPSITNSHKRRIKWQGIAQAMQKLAIVVAKHPPSGNLSCRL